MKIVLHQWEMSPFCNKARRCLKHKGLEFQVVDYNGLLARKAAKMSKVGTLPVLDYGDERIHDSSDIAAFLDARHPEPRLYPTDPKALARARFWEDWAGKSLYFFGIYLRMLDPVAMQKALDLICKGRPGWERSVMEMVFKRRYPKKLKAQGLGRLDRPAVEKMFLQHLDDIEALLGEGPWLGGDALNIGDVSVAAQLDEITRTSDLAPRILERPRIKEWLTRA